MAGQGEIVIVRVPHGMMEPMPALCSRIKEIEPMYHFRYVKKLGFNTGVVKHQLQTPSAGFTALGLIALLGSRRVKNADVVAFLALLLAGTGTSLALASEVRDRGQEWGWRGLVRCMRHPSRKFWRAFISHFGQLLIALLIAFRWWRRGHTPCQREAH